MASIGDWLPSRSILGRRLVHASGAIVPLVALVSVPWELIQAALVVGVFLVAILEWLRLYRGLSLWVFTPLTREYEADSVAGYALYVAGMTVTALVFEPAIAIPALLLLAIADPVGGLLAGDEPRTFKRPRALIGTTLVGLAVTLPLLHPVVAVGGALAATIADGVFLEVRGHVLDDNLLIPVGSAAVMTILDVLLVV